jgi:phage tail sheath protein FI
MTTMISKAPGVYIEEIPATGPIAGVSTSTAAFIGPTLFVPVGNINEPTLVTNWTQFKTRFGEYNKSPRLYLPHAVRGFFDNGGTLAYIVAVAAAQGMEFSDRASGTAIRVAVAAPDGSNVKLEVQDGPVVPASANAKVVKARAPIASAAAAAVTLQNVADGALFQPGDWITIDAAGPTPTTERAAIDSIQAGPPVQLVLKTALSATFPNTASVRLADLALNQRSFRVQPKTGIEAGSAIHLAQATTQADAVVDAVNGDFVTLAAPGLSSAFKLGGTDDVIVSTWEFTLIVTKDGQAPVTIANLSMDKRHSRYFLNIVNGTANSPVKVMLPAQPSTQPPPNNLPKVIPATNLAPGLVNTTAGLGVNAYQPALDALTRVDGVNMVCAPDAAGNTDVQAKVLAHCETMRDRFAIFDPAPTNPGAPDPGTDQVVAQRPKLDSNNPASGPGFGALYFPWIVINDPTSASGSDPLLVPPSGHIAGVYARVDDARGVHKAPANEFINGAVDLERVINDTDQGVINDLGINALRIFPGQARPVVWGARTTALKDDVPFRYINVRRLFLFVEKSIQAGIRWAVFEPNDLSLWKKVDRTIREFLTRVWRSGALFGKTASDAFYIKIDEELNPPAQRALGILTVEIGIAPVRPAEFVVVRMAMWDGGSSVSGG